MAEPENAGKVDAVIVVDPSFGNFVLRFDGANNDRLLGCVLANIVSANASECNTCCCGGRVQAKGARAHQTNYTREETAYH